MKKTKIVATLGPASSSPEVLKELFLNGVNVCRLNFSHGDHDQHREMIRKVKALREELNKPIAILLDTKGPEIRLGNFQGGSCQLEVGDRFNLYMDDRLGDQKGVSISYKNLSQDIQVGDHILIDDGLVDLRVIEKSKDLIKTIVLNEGKLENHKGVNLPGVKLNLESLTAKDKEDIQFGIQEGVDFIAPSFIRKAEDVYAIRQILEDHGGAHIRLISKIESKEGVENMDAIIQASDGIMIARGDMGVEIDPEEVPLVQKTLIQKCIAASKPVITATQMLDSMIRNPRPTRAEVTDVANAILDGTSAIMLSGETASGKYPILAVTTMNRIAIRTEEYMDYDKSLKAKPKGRTNTTHAISQSTCIIARDLGAKAIITATSSGYTSRAISKFHPRVPIIAVTTSPQVQRQCALDFGVFALEAPYGSSTDEVLSTAVRRALEESFIKEGDLVVLTAGLPVGVSGTTNMIQVLSVAHTLTKGQGIGGGKAIGKVIFTQDLEYFEANFQDGDIIATKACHKDLAAYIQRAGGLLSQEEGLTSPSAVLGLDLGIPTIVALKGLDEKLENGQIVTVNATTGQVFAGKVDL